MADETRAPASARAATDTAPRRVSRRKLLQAAGGGVVAVAGAAALYKGLALVTAPARHMVAPPPHGYPNGQYMVADYGVRVVTDAISGVPFEVPPVWNLVITTTLTRRPGLAEQQRLEAALRAIETAYPYAPSGVFALVGYGLPYFHAHIPPAIFGAHLPHVADLHGQDLGIPVLTDAIRYASDPPSAQLEANEVVFHLRSDVLAHLHDVQQALFGRSGTLAGQPAPAAQLADLFSVTSVRTGFSGAGLPRQIAQQAKLPYADAIPASAPMFMGFTSTQKSGQGKELNVSFDGADGFLVRPATTCEPTDYFAGGTTLHISHLIEDLAAWYQLSYDQRVGRMFYYHVGSTPGLVTLDTLWLNPNTSDLDAQSYSVIGHNEAVQIGSRSLQGQALQLRVDFNTMDAMDNSGATPGVHFLAFTPASHIFDQSRNGMDAVNIAQQRGIAPAANGINAFIRATRRQNFLVPPRKHRAFPLLELA